MPKAKTASKPKTAKEPDVLAEAKKSGDKLVARVKGVQRVFTVIGGSGDSVEIEVQNPEPDNSTYKMTVSESDIVSPRSTEEELQTT